MKKRYILLMVLILLFAVSCGQKADADNSGLSAKEVLEKTKAAEESIKSLKMDMNLNIKMKDLDKQMLSTKMTMEMNNEDNDFHADMTVGEMGMEMYFSGGKMYMNNSATGDAWLVTEDEGMLKAMKESMNNSSNPVQVSEFNDKMIDKFTIKEEDTQYILTLDPKENEIEEVQQYFSDVVKKNQPMNMETKINKIFLELRIDKKSFFTDALKMDLDMQFSQDGKMQDMGFIMEASIYDQNKVGKIEVPKEVIDKAQPLPSAPKTP